MAEKDSDFTSFRSKMSDSDSLLISRKKPTRKARKKAKKTKIFSKPWSESDVVLVVEDNEFHVHRYILSLQSPVFKAMFNGNFKDSKQDKIELKDDYEAMLRFLKLLYPTNMLQGYEDYQCKCEIDIDDENIFEILKVADKYGARNIIKQCMKEIGRLKPTNAMRILPYAIRHELPLGQIVDVIVRRVSIKELENFAPELDNDSVYERCLVKKCHYFEQRFWNWQS